VAASPCVCVCATCQICGGAKLGDSATDCRPHTTARRRAGGGGGMRARDRDTIPFNHIPNLTTLYTRLLHEQQAMPRNTSVASFDLRGLFTRCFKFRYFTGKMLQTEHKDTSIWPVGYVVAPRHLPMAVPASGELSVPIPAKPSWKKMNCSCSFDCCGSACSCGESCDICADYTDACIRCLLVLAIFIVVGCLIYLAVKPQG
jgi:hypothetical protein